MCFYKLFCVIGSNFCLGLLNVILSIFLERSRSTGSIWWGWKENKQKRSSSIWRLPGYSFILETWIMAFEITHLQCVCMNVDITIQLLVRIVVICRHMGSARKLCLLMISGSNISCPRLSAVMERWFSFPLFWGTTFIWGFLPADRIFHVFGCRNLLWQMLWLGADEKIQIAIFFLPFFFFSFFISDLPPGMFWQGRYHFKLECERGGFPKLQIAEISQHGSKRKKKRSIVHADGFLWWGVSLQCSSDG